MAIALSLHNSTGGTNNLGYSLITKITYIISVLHSVPVLLYKDDTIIIPTISCLHSLYWTDITYPYIYFIFYIKFFIYMFAYFLKCKCLIANRGSCRCIEGSEASLFNQTQKMILTYCDEKNNNERH